MLLLEEFFAPSEVGRLWSYAMSRAGDFVASEVVSDDSAHHDEQFRRSRVLFDVAEIYPLISERVLSVLPHVLPRLGMDPFPVGQFELQVTASNDAEWFKPHRDSDGGHGGPVSSRELTFVYYGHREPLPFTGGELRLIDGDAATIIPHQNSIVFFPSHYLHEVMPTYCPSGRFEDSRLTFNGWLHR
jgi:SM-20-related protein